MYLPVEEDDIKEVLAYSLAKDGIARMMVRWRANALTDDDFSMRTLFGTLDEIPLEYLASMSNSRNADKVRNRMTITQKQQQQQQQVELSISRRAYSADTRLDLLQSILQMNDVLHVMLGKELHLAAKLSGEIRC